MDMERLVKLAGEAIADDDWWTFADELTEEAPGGAPPGADGRDGSYADLDDLSHRIEEEHGVRLTVDHLRQVRSTAIAWPDEERHEDVAFGVHRRLRSPKTKPLLSIYKKRAADDHRRAPSLIRSPRLTEHRVKFYRAEEKAVDPWEVRMKKRIEKLLDEAESAEAFRTLEGLIETALNAYAKRLGVR